MGFLAPFFFHLFSFDDSFVNELNETIGRANKQRLQSKFFH